MKTPRLNILFLLSFMFLAGCTGANYAFRVTSSSFGDNQTLTNFSSNTSWVDLPGDPVGDTYDTFSMDDEDNSQDGFLTVSGGNFTLSKTRLSLNGIDAESPVSSLISFQNRIDASIENSTTYIIRGGAGSTQLEFEINGTQIEFIGVGFISQLLNSTGSAIAFSGNTSHLITIQLNYLSDRAIFTVQQGDFNASLEFMIPATFGIADGLSISSFDLETQTHIDLPVGIHFD